MLGILALREAWPGVMAAGGPTASDRVSLQKQRTKEVIVLGAQGLFRECFRPKTPATAVLRNNYCSEFGGGEAVKYIDNYAGSADTLAQAEGTTL